MKQSTLKVNSRQGVLVPDSHLIITATEINDGYSSLTIGYPGLPNAYKDLELGETVLFETPDEGLIEIRSLSTSLGQLELLLTIISPKIGMLGGFVESSGENSEFTPDEKAKIVESLEKVKEEIAANERLSAEQVEFLAKKIDDIREASDRLGRKDWINYVVGVVSSAAVSLALTPEATKAVFTLFDSSFTWLFDSMVKFLGPL